MAKKKAKKKASKRASRRAEGSVPLLHANLTWLKDVVGATLKLTTQRAEELQHLYRYLERADVGSRQRSSSLRIRGLSAKR